MKRELIHLENVAKSFGSLRVLDEIDENLYLDALRPLLKSKSRSISARNEFDRQMKLVRFAMGRGFSMEQINRCYELLDPTF